MKSRNVVSRDGKTYYKKDKIIHNVSVKFKF